MNEAVHLLEARGIIMTRRGREGGVFVVTAPAQIPLGEVLLGLKHNAGLIEQCQAVLNQLEPLVFVEATKAANVDAVAELQRLEQNMAVAVDQPAGVLQAEFRRLYRRIAKMGVNAVLTGIYTTLLTFLEQEIGQAVDPVPNYSTPQQVVVKSGALIQDHCLCKYTTRRCDREAQSVAIRSSGGREYANKSVKALLECRTILNVNKRLRP